MKKERLINCDTFVITEPELLRDINSKTIEELTEFINEKRYNQQSLTASLMELFVLVCYESDMRYSVFVDLLFSCKDLFYEFEIEEMDRTRKFRFGDSL